MDLMTFVRTDPDGEAHLIVLERRALEPDPQRPVRILFDVALEHPDATGLPQGEELELLEVLTRVGQAELERHGAHFVGRRFGGGLGQILFHARPGPGIFTAIAACQGRWPERDIDVEPRPDPEWRWFRDNLFPTLRETWVIRHLEHIQARIMQGADMTQEAELWYSVRPEGGVKLQRFTDAALALGWSLREASQPADASQAAASSPGIQRNLPAHWSAMEPEVSRLLTLAEEHSITLELQSP